MINLKLKELSGFIGRVTVVHVVTYFIFGIIFGLLLPKGHIMYAINEMNVYFRPLSDPFVMSSTLFQLIRGAIIAVGIFSFREKLFKSKYGWLSLWGLLVTLSILAPAGAAPGSIEGFIYTKLPLWYHLGYLPDIMLQTLAFSVLLFTWERKRSKKIAIPLVITFGIIVTILLFSLISGTLTSGVNSNDQFFTLQYDGDEANQHIAIILPGQHQKVSQTEYQMIGNYFLENGIRPCYVDVSWENIFEEDVDLHPFYLKPIFSILSDYTINHLSYTPELPDNTIFLYGDHDAFVLSEKIIASRIFFYPCSKTVIIKGAEHDISGKTYMEPTFRTLSL